MQGRIVGRALGSVRALSTALLLVASGAVAAHAQPEDPVEQVEVPAMRVEFRDVSFQLPGPEWQRVDEQLANRIRVAREEPLRREVVTVIPHNAPTALSREEVAAQYFDAQSTETQSDGNLEKFQAAEREINGRKYPALAARFTPTQGTPIVDLLSLLYFPEDYEQRGRLYVLSWADAHSATVPAKALDEFDALVASFAMRPLGEVLLADDFEDPDAGVFPKASPVPDHYLLGYVDGEYAIQKPDPAQDNDTPKAVTAQRFADVAVAVDVRFAGETPLPIARVSCRRTNTSGGASGYFLLINADRGTFRLSRDDKGKSTALLDWRASPAILGPGESNHLELTCAGSEIAASINGTLVGAVRDGTYAEGTVGIGAGDARSTVDARFDNFVITQR